MDSSAPLRLDADLTPSDADLATIRAGLMSFNDAQVGPAQVERIAVYLRDANGTIHGGIVGFFAWSWLSVEWLWVAEEHRGHGHGSALLQEAERLAREANCVAVKLDTYEFQARPFYEGHGYDVFGILEGYPASSRTFYLRKLL